MDIIRDIQSLSEFKKNASKLVKQVQKTRQSIVLTVNGQAVAVLQDAESYQNALNEREITESVEVLKERLAKLREGGKRVSVEEVFAKVSKKYGVKLDEPEMTR